MNVIIESDLTVIERRTMKLTTFTFSIIVVSILIYLDQSTGEVSVTPALTRLYHGLENFKSATNMLTKSLNTAKCAPSPSHGGLHKIAISLEIVARELEKFATDANKVVDRSGNISGNGNQAIKDINKLASGLNKLAKNVRNDASHRDYYGGDFKGVKIGLEHCAKGLENVADAIERARGLSKFFVITFINATQVDKGIIDLHTSITALIKSINCHLKKCGETGADVGYINKGFADFNEGLRDIEETFL